VQFVLVIYHGSYPLPGSPEFEAFPAQEKAAIYAGYAAINKLENVVGGPPLGLPENATTVRVENGSAVTAPGPYLDVKGAVGGFAVVEADDLEAAIAVAALVPQARLGGAVEVRPAATYW
jgi:hypothetical protein